MDGYTASARKVRFSARRCASMGLGATARVYYFAEVKTAGKPLSTATAPESVPRDTAEAAVRDAERIIARWGR